MNNHTEQSMPFGVTNLILYSLFFLSGSAAIIYQLMWQRLLFILFGVDLESITIIVSVFMFGLGIGGLYGGNIADKWPKQLLRIYIMIELAIAGFGAYSPELINTLGNIFLSDSKIVTVIAIFIILALPTLLMGATFPILVSYINRSIHNIGYSVGNLYFINTIGSCLGAFLAGFILLYYMDLIQVIHCAALLNLFIASIALLAFRGKN